MELAAAGFRQTSERRAGFTAARVLGRCGPSGRTEGVSTVLPGPGTARPSSPQHARSPSRRKPGAISARPGSRRLPGGHCARRVKDAFWASPPRPRGLAPRSGRGGREPDPPLTLPRLTPSRGVGGHLRLSLVFPRLDLCVLTNRMWSDRPRVPGAGPCGREARLGAAVRAGPTRSQDALLPDSLAQQRRRELQA